MSLLATDTKNNGLQPHRIRCLLHKVSTSVGRRLREEDGLTDWGCGVALEELLVEVLLDG